MAGSPIAPVRRSRREPATTPVTAFEAISLTLAAFVFCATALGQTRSVVNYEPGTYEQGSLVGPLMAAGLVAAPGLLSLAVRRWLRRRRRQRAR